jgi:hypothetical protein
MLLKGKAVELTDRGIVNYTSELRFVEWSEIERARLEKQMGIETIVLELKDNGPVLARIPFVSRMLLLLSIKRYGLRPSISATFIEGGVEHGLREIQHRIQSWRRWKIIVVNERPNKALQRTVVSVKHFAKKKSKMLATAARRWAQRSAVLRNAWGKTSVAQEERRPADPVAFIQACVRARRVLWTYHVNIRLAGRFIAREAILEAADTYKLVEAYRQVPAELPTAGISRAGQVSRLVRRRRRGG